jgi:hypothetical protein
VLLRRIETRTTNDYGKSVRDRELILEHVREVEPLLRATCTHELDAARPLDRRRRRAGRDRRTGLTPSAAERADTLGR